MKEQAPRIGKQGQGGTWKPNDNQIKALEYVREKQYKHSVTALAEHLGLSRQAIYQWNECRQFVIWWGKRRNEFYATQLPSVYDHMFDRATGADAKGSVADAKLILERFDGDYTPRMRQEVTGADGAPVKTYVNVDVDRVTGKDSDGPEGAEEAEDG